MDLKIQKKTMELLYRLLEGTNGIVPFVSYYPQKDRFPGRKEQQCLKRAAPESQGVSSLHLRKFLEELTACEESSIHAIMVVRNGCVLAEAAAFPYEKKLWHATYSLCKSITGLAVGMLMDEGKLGMDDRIVDLLSSRVTPFMYLKHKNLTIRHLLTMTSGAALNEMGSATEEDWVKAYLESHVRFPHGTKFCYNSMNSYMLSAILTEITGQTMMEYLRSRLWDPLGIENVYWESCPKGRTKGGWGLYLTVEDMAKIAQMVLQKGLWRGQRIVSEQWICRSCQKWVDTGENNGFAYGLHNWILEEENAFLFNGMLGQNIVFYPEKRLFIVTTAGNNELFADGPMMEIIRKYFGNGYWPQDPMDPDPAAYERLKAWQRHMGEPPAGHWALQGGWKTKAPLRIKKRSTSREMGTGRMRRPEAKSAVLWRRLLETVHGQEYRMETNKGALVPRFLQAVHNNYSEGIQTVGFERQREDLILHVTEGSRPYSIRIGMGESSAQELEYHHETYQVAVLGEAAQNEDGIYVLKVRLAFLETPHSRIMKCFFYGDTIRIRFTEQPGWQLIQTAMASVAKGESAARVQGLFAKLDPEYMNYKVRTAVETEVWGRVQR